MTGGGEIQARTLYKADTAVKLNLTLVMECNKKPPFAETPDGQADGERIVDILFGSFFTAKSELWNDDKHIYPQTVSNYGVKNIVKKVLTLMLYSQAYLRSGETIVDTKMQKAYSKMKTGRSKQ